MNIFKKIKQARCQHNWYKEVVEVPYFEFAGGEYTTGRPKWTCTKCKKVLWTNPQQVTKRRT